MQELPTPVHGLRVLAPVQEPWRLPAAEVRGGPLGALRGGGAHHDRASLASPGTSSGARNHGAEVVREGGIQWSTRGRIMMRTGGGDYNEWSSTGDKSGASGASYAEVDESLTEVEAG